MTTVLAITLIAVGLAGVVRGVAIVSTGGTGWFPLDPLISIVAGFGLILLGQALLDLGGRPGDETLVIR